LRHRAIGRVGGGFEDGERSGRVGDGRNIPSWEFRYEVIVVLCTFAFNSSTRLRGSADVWGEVLGYLHLGLEDQPSDLYLHLGEIHCSRV
jgi:hypothetical protein